MQRRKFLKHLIATPVAASTFMSGNPFMPKLKLAKAFSGKTLVTIFLRGGCDGLNTVVPYGDDDYYNLRPSIAIPSSSVVKLNSMLGLHPSLAPLKSIYDQGDLAVMPAVHYDNASRSHFSGQQLVEAGGPNKISSGWINRYLSTQTLDGEIPALSMGTSLAHQLRGDTPVIAIKDLSNISLSSEENLDMRSRLRMIYEQNVSASEANRKLLHDSGELGLDLLDTFDSLDTGSYSPANGASYPSGAFGTQLRDVALLIKKGVGLEAATVTLGGWDHHSNQGGVSGRQASLHASLANGVKAMYTDLGSEMNNVVILVLTEFGRTAKQNTANGTDHGNAASWFAISKAVKGGVHFGPGKSWPGLATDKLYKERFLAHTIDMRNVYAEILAKHFGKSGSISSALPGLSYSSVGFL